MARTTRETVERKEQKIQTAPPTRASCPPRGRSSLPSSCHSSRRDRQTLQTEPQLSTGAPPVYKSRLNALPASGNRFCCNTVLKFPSSRLYYISKTLSQNTND